MFFPNGNFSFPNGKMFFPCGKFSFPNRKKSFPNGKKSFPSGNFSFPNGKMFFPNGNFLFPNEKMSFPKGIFFFPKAKTAGRRPAGRFLRGIRVYWIKTGNNTTSNPYMAVRYRINGLWSLFSNWVFSEL